MNLIYIFADQLRYQSVGYAGDRQAITPNIDRFTSTAVNFTNAIAGSPVCTAYRAALMTGKHTTSNGMVINELRINPNQRCLGHVLTDAGYATAYIGKWHLYSNELGNHDDPKNSFVPPGPHRLGFDGEWKAYNFHHTYFNTYYHADTPEKIYYGKGVFEPDAQVDFAIDVLDRHGSAEKPYALFLSLGTPHDPWGRDNVPARYWDMHAATDFPNPPNYRALNDTPYADLWAFLSESDRVNLEDWRRGYYAQTTALDAALGRLFDAIRADTIVVFTSDHGELFGAHGRRAKNIFYEEAVRVPMLVQAPGAQPLSTDVCLSTVDIMPTLLGLLGITAPADLEGMDLSHIVLGRPGPEPDFAFMQICGATADWIDGHEWRGIRDKRHTYAVYRVDRKEFLFDHVNDPLQLANLADDAGCTGLLADYREKLARKMKSLNDTFEACTWYQDNWTDGDRNIIRSATMSWTDTWMPERVGIMPV